ncbi:Spx/MgsR family RNA polymerase-binding regulatory protein [Lacticaseibacillus mingshuiensis]|uniref:Spx/MgsR family RNA polymerase-binding regulatory protein n=1 Tax=Lacticaseibacillus mingshuiensis TaxID=2799574 RepID=A0ABW4CGC4_9LACO|nr:Spx/MgsR family RNA polymerase-binding regulatory protein [Lacticaseibacillus mingshuiensis]
MPVTVITRTSCSSSRRAVAWLQDNDIPHIKRTSSESPLSFDEVLKLLIRCEHGFLDILSVRGRAYASLKDSLANLQLNDLIAKIVEDPSLLRYPIIMDGEKVLVGFNRSEIRKFTPSDKRKADLRQSLFSAEAYA